MQKREAIFLDRDGVINVKPRHRYLTQWEEFRFLPGVLESLKTLARHRKTVIVVSNQAGVGRGILSLKQLRLITRRMLREIRRAGGRIRAVYHCPHTPNDRCLCRKPRTGMLRRAGRSFAIDLRRSMVVGDNETDLLMGKAAGCRTVLVLTGVTSRSQAKHLRAGPDFIARDLPEAARWILAHER